MSIVLGDVTTESLCLVIQIADQPITKEETYSVSQSLVLSQNWTSIACEKASF